MKRIALCVISAAALVALGMAPFAPNLSGANSPQPSTKVKAILTAEDMPPVANHGSANTNASC
jgi:hypothetical protein